MGGGLMQLVAYGAQDVYLTGDPQITYFKVVYRRHTNFSMECIAQTANGTPDDNSLSSYTISRNGDLVGAMHFEVPGGFNKQKFATLITDISVEIGGQQIDKHYGEWLDIWHELTQPPTDKAKTALLPGDGNVNFVPLQFWFNRNVGLALPLIALQYHEVKINVNWGALQNATPKLWVDYIFLDTEERKRFAQMSHEYLIDQLQCGGTESSGKKWRLNFNHPVKEIVWTTGGSSVAKNNIASWKLVLNGHDRFAAREETYFTQLQKYYHHTRVPKPYRWTSDFSMVDVTEGAAPGITVAPSEYAVYSFALRPEEHQPSGTCNFSRIDNATMIKSGGVACSPKFYAVNYNVLRVVSGMGGLAYSN